MTEKKQILQLIPCEPGWYAKYKQPEGELTLYTRLSCWALIEFENDNRFHTAKTSFRAVNGMTPSE